MAGRRALSRHRVFPGRVALAGGAALAGIAAMIATGPPAAAMVPHPPVVDPCSNAFPANTSVHSTLQVVARGVDSPVMTVTSEIDVPKSWPGASGLFADRQQQGNSLVCFLPVDQYNYQVEPPAVSVKATSPGLVHFVSVATVTDGAESGWQDSCALGQCWQLGLWSIQKTPAGYTVSFAPSARTLSPERLSWTVTLRATGLNVVAPAPQPAADDGQGTLTWSFPPPAKQAPAISASLAGPLPAAVNLASDRWWPRWLSDSSWTIDDGLAFDLIILLFSLWLRRRAEKGSERRRLANALVFLASLSAACYAWYVGDGYVWHNGKVFGWQLSDNAIWRLENSLLVGVSMLYFAFALRVSGLWASVKLWHWISFAAVFLAAVGVLVSAPRVDLGVWRVFADMIPLLFAMTLSAAGTLVWIRHVWPFKGESRPEGSPDPGPWRRIARVTALVLGLPVVSIVILGQSAAASYYYWTHSDWWRQWGGGAPRWVADDLLNDSHWWIGDGIQWSFYFALFAGAFALLRTMGDGARGVFLAPNDREPDERAALSIMAALAGCLYVGTWGYYDGFAFPVPFLVTFVGLWRWGLTRRLSDLDRRARVVSGPDWGTFPSGVSKLVKYREDLLDAAKAASTDPAANPAAASQSRAGSPPKRMPSTLATEIPLATVPPGLLDLEAKVDPGATALALGPADAWWDNGTAAVKRGAYLAIAPIGFDIFIAWNDGSVSLRNFPFGLQDTVGYGVSVAIAWITGLFLFGVLVPYLRGMRTPLKGVAFGLVALLAYGSDAGLRHLLGVAPYPTWFVDGLLAVALFAVTGLLLDLRTLGTYEELPLLGTIYRLGGVRVAVTSVTAVVVVGISLWQAIYLTNQTSQQRAQNFSNAAQYAGTSFGGK